MLIKLKYPIRSNKISSALLPPVEESSTHILVAAVWTLNPHPVLSFLEQITKAGAMTTIAPKAELNKSKAPKIKLILVVFPNEISLISFELDTKFGEGTPPPLIWTKSKITATFFRETVPNDPWMIWDELETFGDNHYWRGKLKSKCLFKKLSILY